MFLLAAILVAEVALRLAGDRLDGTLVYYSGEAQVKVDQLESSGNVAIVLAGTSMVLYGIDPTVVDAEIDGTSYNAGLAGAIPELTERWLLEEVLTRESPGTVVWALSSLDLNENTDRWAVEAYNAAPATTNASALGRFDRRLSRQSHLLRHRRLLRDPGEMINTLRDRVDPRLEDASAAVRDDGYFSLGDDNRIDAGIERQIDRLLADFELGGAQTEAVRRTIGALQGRGIDVVLVDMAVPQRYVVRHPGGEAQYREAQAHLRSLAGEFGVPVIDLSAAAPDDSAFVDYTHLGETAGADVARQLGQELAALDRAGTIDLD